MTKQLLTDKQEKLLKIIKEFIKEHGFSPTVRELCEVTGLRSTSTIQEYIYK